MNQYHLGIPNRIFEIILEKICEDGIRKADINIFKKKYIHFVRIVVYCHLMGSLEKHTYLINHNKQKLAHMVIIYEH